jgi:hypothetical protein
MSFFDDAAAEEAMRGIFVWYPWVAGIRRLMLGVSGG